QLRGRTAAADGQVRQDKLFKQPKTQLRGNRLPTTASSHSSPPKNRILPDPGTAAENPASQRLSGKVGGPEKPATSCRPVGHLVTLPRDMVTAVLVQLEGHSERPDQEVRRPTPDGFQAPQADPCTTVQPNPRFCNGPSFVNPFRARCLHFRLP